MKSLFKNKLVIFIIIFSILLFALSKFKTTSKNTQAKSYSATTIVNLSSSNFKSIPNKDNSELYNLIVKDDENTTTIEYNFELTTDDPKLTNYKLKLLADSKEIPFVIDSKEYTEYEISSNFNGSLTLNIDNKNLQDKKLLISCLFAPYNLSQAYSFIEIKPINLDTNFKFIPNTPKSHFNYNKNWGYIISDKTIDEFMNITDNSVLKDTFTTSNLNIFIPKAFSNEKSALIIGLIDNHPVKINGQDYLYYEFNENNNDCIADELKINEEDLKNGNYLTLIVITNPFDTEAGSIGNFSDSYKLEIN